MGLDPPSSDLAAVLFGIHAAVRWLSAKVLLHWAIATEKWSPVTNATLVIKLRVHSCCIFSLNVSKMNFMFCAFL